MLETRYYGEFGGAYLPEILVQTFEELAVAFQEAKDDPGFWEEYKNEVDRDGPPSPALSISSAIDHAALKMVSQDGKRAYYEG